MSNNQIKAAEAILRIGSFGGSTTFSEVFGQNINEGWDIDDITSAAEYLEANKFINMITTKNGGYQYRLTPMGNKFREDGKSIADFIAGEKQKELKAIQKEERDDLHKKLQIEELEIKVKSLEDMQERQKTFWESGIERDKRQKWQFWLTLFLAGAAFLMSVFNFVKDIILPK